MGNVVQLFAQEGEKLSVSTTVKKGIAPLICPHEYHFATYGLRLNPWGEVHLSLLVLRFIQMFGNFC